MQLKKLITWIILFLCKYHALKTAHAIIFGYFQQKNPKDPLDWHELAKEYEDIEDLIDNHMLNLDHLYIPKIRVSDVNRSLHANSF